MEKGVNKMECEKIWMALALMNSMILSGEKMSDGAKKVIQDGFSACHVLEERIKNSLSIASEYGCIDGGHHKMWTIDQMVRELAGESYQEWVDNYNKDEEGNYVYEWDTGINP